MGYEPYSYAPPAARYASVERVVVKFEGKKWVLRKIPTLKRRGWP